MIFILGRHHFLGLVAEPGLLNLVLTTDLIHPRPVTDLTLLGMTTDLRWLLTLC
jgi:hypothetical protein